VRGEASLPVFEWILVAVRHAESLAPRPSPLTERIR
jgi:hypothetical protein